MSQKPARVEEARPSALSRRRVLSTAAWSVPVVAVASAAPAFAASPSASVAWDGANGTVLNLAVLNDAGGGRLLSTQVLPSGPRAFTINNPAATALTDVTAQVSIAYDSGVLLLNTKGVGVYSVYDNNSPNRVVNRTETPDVVSLVARTFSTSQTLVLNDVPARDTASIPVVFGLTQRGGLGVGLLATFNITLTLMSGGTTVASSTSSITVPAGITL